jgi:hypothetical protein
LINVLSEKHYPLIVIVKQRVFNHEFEKIRKVMEGKPLVYYDQDPWQSFISDSNSHGFYLKLQQELNIRKVVVTSKWWADFMRKRLRFRIEFARMGVLSEYCQIGKPIRSRLIENGFKGTLHPHRLNFFERLDHEQGIQVDVRSPQRGEKYVDFLSYLSELQVFIHFEGRMERCDDLNLSLGAGLWVKDIEVAARGTIVIRDWHEDARSYSLEEIPTIFFYKDLEEIPGILERIRQKTNSELEEMQTKAINNLKNEFSWKALVQTLFD